MRDRKIKKKRRILPLVEMIKRTKTTMQINKKKNHNKMQIPRRKKLKPLLQNKK